LTDKTKQTTGANKDLREQTGYISRARLHKPSWRGKGRSWWTTSCFHPFDL